MNLKDTMFYRYFERRLGLEIYETEKDFVLYKIEDDKLCIYDFYSENEEKGSMFNVISEVVKIGQEQGCRLMEGYLDKEGNYLDRAKYLMEKYGMKPYKETDDYVYYIKEL